MEKTANFVRSLDWSEAQKATSSNGIDRVAQKGKTPNMKNRITFPFVLTTVVCCLAIFIQLPNAQDDSGKIEGRCIGNVQWSILPPHQFEDENGPGWVLMDGYELRNTDALKNRYGLSATPDARGCFLRALNGIVQPGGEITEPRKDWKEKGDPNGNFRTSGSFQADSVAPHTHRLPLVNRDFEVGKDDRKGFARLDGKEIKNSKVNSVDDSAASQAKAENDAVDPDTRPRNIALYVYIKVN